LSKHLPSQGLSVPPLPEATHFPQVTEAPQEQDLFSVLRVYPGEQEVVEDE